MIYSVRETNSGYFLDCKDDKGNINETYLVSPKNNGYECSCEYFKRTKNFYNHFHILVVKEWIKSGKPKYARYYKDKNNKLMVLIDGNN